MSDLAAYLDCDATLAFHLKLIQILRLAALADGSSELHETVCQRALAMVHMGNDAAGPELRTQPGGQFCLLSHKQCCVWSGINVGLADLKFLI